jgi:hypothetical protein
MTLLSVSKSGIEIGTIIDAAGPANSDWLICDGSVFEQDLYSKYVRKVSTLHPQCWSHVELITPPSFNLSHEAIAKKGSTIVIMPESDNDVFYSTDNGANWQTSSNALPASGNWSLVTSNGSIFVSLLYGTNNGAYSSDGISWTGFTMPTTLSCMYLLWNGTIFIAGQQTSNAVVYYSSNGYSWSAGATFGSGVYPNTLPKSCDSSGYFIFQDSNYYIRKTNNGSSLSTSANPVYFTEGNNNIGMFYYARGEWWGMSDYSQPVWFVSSDGGDTWKRRFMNNNDVYDDYFYPYFGSFDSGEELVFLDYDGGFNWVTDDGRTFSPRINTIGEIYNSVFISKSVGAVVLSSNRLSSGEPNRIRAFRLKYTSYNYTTHFQVPVFRPLLPGMYKYIKVR